MAVDLIMSTTTEHNAVQEAASGLESVQKLIRLLSHQQSSQQAAPDEYQAVADMAVNKFKRVISLLGRTNRELTGHARFRRAPPVNSNNNNSIVIKNSEQDDVVSDESETKVYNPTPIQQVPFVPPPPVMQPMFQRKDSLPKTISFSYSPAVSRASSFMSSLTGDSDGKQLSAGGKPPLCSASCVKRKCSSSENGGSGKCSGASSGRCQCSKRR